MDHIADGAAAVGALGGLHHGKIAEQGHQLVRLVEARTIDVNIMIQDGRSFPARLLGTGGFHLADVNYQGDLNHARWPKRRQAAIGALMAKTGRKGAQAGGFILAVGIIGGAIVGGLLGQPSAGLLIGLVLGTLIALALWWRDRG